MSSIFFAKAVNSTLTIKLKQPNLGIMLKAFNSIKLHTLNIFVITKPFNQIFLSYFIYKIYTISTGVILQHLKVASKSFRRMLKGWRLLFSFMQKKLSFSNPIIKRNPTLLKLNTLKCYNVLKSILVQFWIYLSVWKLRVFISNTYNGDAKQLKKFTFIKRKLRRKLVVK